MDVVPQNRFYILDRRLDLDEEKPGIDDDERKACIACMQPQESHAFAFRSHHPAVFGIQTSRLRVPL